VTAALLAVSIYWDLPVLLVVVSLVYAATRHDRWDKIVREAFGWGTRIAPEPSFQAWPGLCATWLKGQGFLDKTTK